MDLTIHAVIFLRNLFFGEYRDVYQLSLKQEYK